MNGKENKKEISLIFLADTHLGFDLPVRPRIMRRRRGEDFFANYNRVIQGAKEKGADIIVHGGDMFFRKKVHPAIIERVFEPLVESYVLNNRR